MNSTSRLENAPFVAVADYRGITVAEIDAFRRSWKQGVDYEVIKNKLARARLPAPTWRTISQHLTGMTGWIISGEDPIACRQGAPRRDQGPEQEEKFHLQGRLL